MRSDQRHGLIGCAGIVLVAVVVGVCISVGGGSDQGEEAEEPRPWTERCFSAWDGSVADVVKRVKTQLRAPDTFDHVETRYTTNPRADGTHGIRMDFSAKNALGVPLRHTAVASVDPATCQASGVTITG